ncbi:MAG: metallophosphoesterase [Victivallales bacterium]|nr:metallophosphoesterase [Victivallales bacterium]
MRYPKFTLKVGAAKPFEALHVSDTHLVFSDGRDNPVKFQIAMRRKGEFEFRDCGRNLPYFLDALQYARENNLLLLHTGDLIDFASEQNCEVARKLFELSEVDYLMCAGNHEYTHYSGQHPETEEEQAAGRLLVPHYFKNSLFFASRIINGVNLLAVDNGDDQFQEGHIPLLQAEIARGLPIVLLIHVPIYTPELFHLRFADTANDNCPFCDCPPENQRGAAANETTRKFLDILRGSGLLKAVLTGHIHLRTECTVALWDSIPQVVAGAGYYGMGEHLTFV